MNLSDLHNLQDKKIAIIGLGNENLALTKYLISKNIKVTVCDIKEKGEIVERLNKDQGLSISFNLGPHYLDDLNKFDIIFRTPGIPYLNKNIQEAVKNRVDISSQMKLFFNLCPCPIIGITGTKGKGTTTTLIGEILKASGKKVWVGGNIGNAPVEFLDKLSNDDLVVLELSSFQLQDLGVSPHVAVVLDIKIDHLDYHKNNKEYIESKTNIVRHQTTNDFAVINADYLTSIEFATITKAQTYWFSRRKSVDLGAFVLGKKIILRTREEDIVVCNKDEVQLRGEHNLENITAAITASYLSGASLESIKKIIKVFKGLEHRLEFIKEIDGVKYYNDSFSTTPDTTIAAIKSFREPIILFLGGSEKNADYSELIKIINSSTVKMVISIGLTSKRVVEKIRNPKIKIVKNTQPISNAVKLAKENSQSGDVILLSPASASFDRFANYKDRGEKFCKEVLK